MHYSFKVSVKRIKQLPKVTIWGWIMLVGILLFLLIRLFFSAHPTFDDLQNYEIEIDSAYLRDSHDTKGSRMKLEIVSGSTTYYAWYPQSNYINFADDIENDLLSGKVTSVEVKIANTQSVRDRLLNQKRVVDIRSSSTVYYDLDSEMTSLQHHYLSLWLAFIVIFVFWLFYTLFACVIYRVLILKRI